MNERQEQILKTLIEEFTKTAEPVGSAFLKTVKGFDVSPATIRKELSELEALGFILQPHTSAGRIPTEKGYRYFLDHFFKPKSLTKKELTDMSEGLRSSGEATPQILRRFAKGLAEATRETVILGFGPHDVYYTGISNLFSKPEFIAAARAVTLSSVVDRFDEIMSQLWDKTSGIQVKVGSECPFGKDCSSVLVKCQGKSSETLLIILGPMRLSYERVVSVAHQAKSLLEELL